MKVSSKRNLKCNLLSQSLSHLAKGANQARFLVRKGVKGIFAMIAADSTGAHASERQLFDYRVEEALMDDKHENEEGKRVSKYMPANCINTSLTQIEPQLVVVVIRSLTFLLLVKMYMERGFSLRRRRKWV